MVGTGSVDAALPEVLDIADGSRGRVSRHKPFPCLDALALALYLL